MNRREFLLNSLGLAGITYAGSVFTSCSPPTQVRGILSGPNKTLGHQLHQEIKSSFITNKEHHDVVIVGGGVTGLAAARYLSKHNVDFILVELEQRTGGNAQYGTNSVSSFPLGAHYLPLPALNDLELIHFLEEANVITGYEGAIPIYNDYYICFDPKERLYINGHWQEGIVPRSGLSPADVVEMERFHQLMEFYKNAKGQDGKEAFCIPLAYCSKDPAFTELDTITFDTFLKKQKFNSPSLSWYVNYCCADDYGALPNQISAWAGIHYFTSRKGVAANATADTVLTWPEGNGWLIKQFQPYTKGRVLTNSLVYEVGLNNGKPEVKIIDGSTAACTSITANKILLATPQFINQHILSPQLARSIDYNHFTYSPWMTANLTLTSDLENRHGEPLSWDNVIYGSNSLGYVRANHQSVAVGSNQNVITYYAPLLGNDALAERKIANTRSYEQWYQMIIHDLKKPHPNIEQGLTNLDIWIWGHGMIRPTPRFIFGTASKQASAIINKQIYFAHSDCCGISIFEEAFYCGTQAAKNILQS